MPCVVDLPAAVLLLAAGLAEAAGHAWCDLPHFGTWRQRVQLVKLAAGLVLTMTLGELVVHCCQCTMYCFCTYSASLLYLKVIDRATWPNAGSVAAAMFTADVTVGP
jgi:hypothetical protein